MDCGHWGRGVRCDGATVNFKALARMGDQHMGNHFHACFSSRLHGERGKQPESADRMGVDECESNAEWSRRIETGWRRMECSPVCDGGRRSAGGGLDVDVGKWVKVADWQWIEPSSPRTLWRPDPQRP